MNYTEAGLNVKTEMTTRAVPVYFLHCLCKKSDTKTIGKETALRIWDIEPERLCRKHLLGEHRELHALWAVLTEGKKGYSRHPETIRWMGKMRALYARHEQLVTEMLRRGYSHSSPLDIKGIPRELKGHGDVQDSFLNTYEEQLLMLRAKGCQCKTDL